VETKLLANLKSWQRNETHENEKGTVVYSDDNSSYSDSQDESESVTELCDDTPSNADNMFQWSW
jgi:hypothetical protein